MATSNIATLRPFSLAEQCHTQNFYTLYETLNDTLYDTVAMLYCRGGHWVWRGQHMLQHKSQTNKETPSWAVPRAPLRIFILLIYMGSYNLLHGFHVYFLPEWFLEELMLLKISKKKYQVNTKKKSNEKKTLLICWIQYFLQTTSF